ncbi:MAG: Biopolymer transport protein ExbD/TolR [Phycisphaerales bacterium]|nr:Biopolymer transport protein ExbD/TolR [Phycisphaerales bacterium]
MKMKGAKAVHYDSGPNMTPLVDVVMVILIFLMLAGQFGTAQFLLSKQSIKQKGGGGDYKRDPNKPVETPLEIRVDNSRDGVGFVAQGTGIAPTGDAEKLLNELTAKREAFNSAGTPTDQIQVVLYPARNVKYKYLIAIYQAALQAKYEKIAFATSH